MRKHDFEGVTVHACHKGGNSQAEMDRANQISQQQLAQQQQQFQMQQQIQQQQLGLQQQQLGMVNPSLQAIIANGGMLPAQQAAMTSNALNQIGAGERQAVGAINQNLVARGITGGQNAGGGAIAQNYAGLEQGLLGQSANALNNIQLAKGQGLESALNTALGIGGLYGQQATALGGQYDNQALGLGNQGIGALGQGV